MAEDIVTSVASSEEVRPLLRELNQELALCDALKYKNKTLLNNVPAHNAQKAKSLSDEYHASVDAINESAAEIMDREIQAMGQFSEQVRSFNDLSSDYVFAIALLRQATEGK